MADSQGNPTPTTPTGPGPVRRFVLPAIFIIALFVALIVRRPPPPNHYQIRGEIFGTSYSVKVVFENADAVQDEAKLKADIDAELGAIDQAMSTYKKTSELSTFNQSQSTSPIAISKGLAAVLAESLRLHKLTGGAFDITVGPLVNAWGFGPDKALRDPAKETLDALKKRVGSDKLTLDPKGPTLTKSRADIAVDLSAIAKGYAVDQVGLLLEGRKITNYMIEIGGEVRARGQSHRKTVWRLGIERPQNNSSRAIAAVVPLENLSMATSGNYRNFYTRKNGEKVSHVIDGRTGTPVPHPFSSVTVLHKDCITADALATALFVLGHEEGLKLAEKENIAALYVLPKGDGFELKASPAFPEFRRL